VRIATGRDATDTAFETNTLADGPVVRGMIARVPHLITVVEEQS